MLRSRQVVVNWCLFYLSPLSMFWCSSTYLQLWGRYILQFVHHICLSTYILIYILQAFWSKAFKLMFIYIYIYNNAWYDMYLVNAWHLSSCGPHQFSSTHVILQRSKTNITREHSSTTISLSLSLQHYWLHAGRSCCNIMENDGLYIL